MYVSESLAAHVVPVLTYYQMLQSFPAAGSDELHRDLSNMRNRGTMRAYGPITACCSNASQRPPATRPP